MGHQSLIPRHRSSKQGMLPGSAVYVGKEAPTAPTIHAMVYSKLTFTEKTLQSLDELSALGWSHGNGDIDLEDAKLLWLNIDGLGDTQLLTEIGKRFEINSLAIEDILNTEQRTKLDDYDHFLFVVMKMLESKRCSPSVNKGFDIRKEQVSFILGKNYLVTFLEDPGDVFDPVRQQLRENKGRVRRMGSDYLLYSLMDCIVDNYFTVMEVFGEHLEHLSDVLMRRATPQTLKAIHKLRQQTLQLRRCLWPLREVLGHMERDEGELIHSGTKMYVRDVYDHAVEVIDSVETNRDVLSGMADMYLSASSYQLNVVMKLLTIISTIFIPLTFITSVYGMNFKFMPELEQPWGYPAVMGVMLLIAVGMLVFFQRKKWLG